MPIFAHNRRAGVDASSEPPTSGWPALYRTVRDADITKVDDCRDDIDTLLVFAGLYSAVLTAFVIESYTHLQQDTQDVIVGLLQQLVAKNFTSGPGYLNSTIPLPSLPPFEPPLWAIRVNVLWFTSLLLSLASASFGILVKQWLREYLAIDHAAPRERLRARQYRYPAMSEWKVFEIAAFLPLLLQLSLGLFFLGLCFFTASVHSSVGYTTIPVVCAWLFLLLVTTIAPLFSPRCPFKTTFLKSSLRAGRCFVGPPLRSLLRFVQQLLLSSHGFLSLVWTIWTDCARAAFKWARTKWNRFAETLVRSSSSLHLKWFADFYVIFWIILLSPVTVPMWAMKGLWFFFDFWKQSASSAASHEEEQIIKTEEEDLKILLSVDAMMSDDGLLPSMLDAVQQQAGTSPAKVVEFILHMIRRRVSQELDEGRLTFWNGVAPDFRVLSKFAWSTIVDVLTSHLRQYSGSVSASDVSSPSPSWVFGATSILLSHPQSEPSDLAALREVIVVPPRATVHSCVGGVPLYQCSPRLTSPRTISEADPETSQTCQRCVLDTYKMLLCQDPEHSHPSLRHLLDSHMSEEFATSSKILMKDLLHVIVPLLRSTELPQKDWADFHASYEAFHIVLNYGKEFGRADDAVELCTQMLLTESGTRTILLQFAALHPQCRITIDLWTIFNQASPDDQRQMQSQMITVLERLCSSEDDGSGDVPLDYIRLCEICHLTMSLHAGRTLAKAVERYYHTQGWRKELLNQDYWYSITRRSPSPEELFEQDQALASGYSFNSAWIPTELVDALWLFVPEEHRERITHSTLHDRGFTL